MNIKSIQSKFIISIIITLFAVAALVLLTQEFYDRYTKASLARTYISDLTGRAEEELKRIYQPVENILTIAQRWGQSGLLETSKEELIDATFMPILEKTPQIQSVKLARSGGSFYFLSKVPDGWETIVISPSSGSEKALRYLWSDQNRMKKREEITFNYYPLSTPWYVGARDSVRANKTFWTAVRYLVSAQSPGITASIGWKEESGQFSVLAFDVLLKEIYTKISGFRISENSKVFLFREDGRVFNSDVINKSKSQEELAGNLFIDCKPDKMPLEAAILKQYFSENQSREDPISFRYNQNVYWSSVREIEDTRRPFWIGLVIPEVDMFTQVNERRGLLTIITLIFSASGFFTIILLTKKFRRQILNQNVKTDIRTKVLELIKQGEDTTCEFKSTIRTNLKTGESGKEIEMAWLKTVCAFMNSEGGFLIFGVQDKGEILGISADKFENEDKVHLHLKNLINQHIGAEFTVSLRAQVLQIADKEIVLLQCDSSQKPVFLKNKSEEFFYIRSGPSSVKLPVSKTLEYIENRRLHKRKKSR